MSLRNILSGLILSLAVVTSCGTLAISDGIIPGSCVFIAGALIAGVIKDDKKKG